MKLCEEKQCMGCGACQNICPINCITMKENEYGFLMPVIDREKCLECGKCASVCPRIIPVEKKVPVKVYAGSVKNEEERAKCASGGIASFLYRKCIQEHGVAYGVQLNEQHLAVFARAEEEKELEEFRGSKYVGSITGDIYQKVKKDLEDGRKVLFTGMSCQVAGLLKYLGKEYNNLLTVDILCHGMPSHLYFKEYLEDCEKKLNDKAEKISFRDNNIFRLKIEYEKNNYECLARYEKYFAGYTSLLFYRDSCYHCSYADEKRIADITLGDFWGYKQEERLSPTDLGVSMILINSKRGDTFFQEHREELQVIPATLEKARTVNEQLRCPSKEHPYRKEFMACYKEKGFAYASDKVIDKIIRHNKRKERYEIVRKVPRLLKRCMRYLKRKMKKHFGSMAVGKKVRTLWRNGYERKQIKNTDFTILSNTCIGGVISHDLGLRFLSPTVNLYIRPEEFVRFLENLEYYLSLELVETEHPAKYPVAKLGDITLYLKHYNTFAEAKEKWEERKKRINYHNLYVMMTDRDFSPPDAWRKACPKEVLEKFDRLQYKKVCFTGERYQELDCTRVVRKKKENNCVGIITDVSGYTGKRLYQYAEKFDYIKWLNE